MMRLIIFFNLIFFTSCVGFHYTEINEANSIRPNNPNVFKFKKASFRNSDKSLVDFNSIYLIDSQNYQSKISPIQRQNNNFFRFFAGGQVLHVYSKSMPQIERINNKNVGIPGYFFIRDNKIRIELLDENNGGQLSFQFGEILKNGDIMLYDINTRSSNKSFKKLEKRERKTYWKRNQIPEIIGYIPNW